VHHKTVCAFALKGHGFSGVEKFAALKGHGFSHANRGEKKDEGFSP
jgi:hypothetical protein